MNKPGYLGLSILELRKTAMYEFWCHYLKPKIWWESKAFLYWIQTVSCENTGYLQRHCRRCWIKILHLNYEIDRLLPIGKNEKVIGLMKDELEGQIIKEFLGLRAKSYS